MILELNQYLRSALKMCTFGIFFVGKLLIVIIDCLYLLYIRFKNILIKKIEAMKRLKKTTLETGVKVLDDLEMKSVTGGYGDVGHFGKYYYCSCDMNGANPPFRSRMVTQ